MVMRLAVFPHAASTLSGLSVRALLVLTGGCVSLMGGCRFGEAQFSSNFADVGFDPGGTVFSYVDARDASLAEQADPPVAVAMTWIVFDPSSDLGDVDGASLFAMSHEMSLRDGLAIVFPRQGALDAGENFSATTEGEVVIDGDLDFAVHLAPERLDAASTYADVVPFGSRRTLEVALDAVSFTDADAGVSGTLTLTFDAVEGLDPGNARKGSIEGRFRAPLVVERTAERNLALLRDQTPVLPLPLDGRGAP
jgi:hypothetical protein